MPPLRLLSPEDLRGLMALSAAAGWNQTEADWRRLLALEPEGCFGIEAEGRLAACSTAICYGKDLAWIGMVLTLPEFRGRGYATALTGHCLEYCGKRGVARVKLDATDLGRPVYARLGFLEEYAVERWAGELPAAPAAPMEPDYRLDRMAFGADRSRLLALAGAARAGRVAQYIGPIVARSAGEARERVLRCGARGAAFWDLPRANPAAEALARSLGFERRRSLVRMRRGPVLEEHPEYVFALAGFEYG